MRSGVKVALILAGVAAFVGVIVWDAERARAAMTAEASATITRIVLQRDQDSSDSTQVSFRYAANGSNVEATHEMTGDHSRDFAQGQQVRICYNPEDLQSARITDEACGA